MSLAQREIWDNGKRENKMNSKHIEIIRFDAAKITIKEYINGNQLEVVSYQPAIIKMIGARLLVINADNGEEYYDCRYEDCTIKRKNG